MGDLVRSNAAYDGPEAIPDLYARVHDLTLALQGLVAATGDPSLNNQEQALAKAQLVLANKKFRPRPTASD